MLLLLLIISSLYVIFDFCKNKLFDLLYVWLFAVILLNLIYFYANKSFFFILGAKLIG